MIHALFISLSRQSYGEAAPIQLVLNDGYWIYLEELWIWVNLLFLSLNILDIFGYCKIAMYGSITLNFCYV